MVKADGLAAGKGVIVTDDRDAALAHAEAYLPAGPVLIEEFLAGPEVSLFFLSDGDHVLPLSPAQDYKRLRDGDEGPNTGGMGAYSPLPWLNDRFGGEDEFVDHVTREVAEPVIRQLDAEGTPFIGLLYAGLILTERGVKVIEFNARFGDPETQVVLPRLVDPLSRAAAGRCLRHARGSARAPRSPRRPRSRSCSRARATPRRRSPVACSRAWRPQPPSRACTSPTPRRRTATAGSSPPADACSTSSPPARRSPRRATARTAALARIDLEGGQYRTDIAARVVEP